MVPFYSFEQASSFLLHKQRLLSPQTLPDLPRLVEEVGGLHATSPTTPYLSLFARCAGFEKEDLDDMLYTRRRLARLRCVRKTLYVLPRDLLPAAFVATHAAVEQASRRFLRFRRVTEGDYEALSAEIIPLLQGKEMTARAIKKTLETAVDVSAVLNLMCDQGLLVRGRPEKSWKDRSFLYCPFAEAYAGLDLHSLGEPLAVLRLVEFYLHAYGPATLEDIAWWTGLGKTKAHQALSALGTGVQWVRIAGLEGEFWLHRQELDGLEACAPPPSPVANFLPVLDHLIMGYKDRRRFLRPEDRDCVFDRSGNATSTILLDGQIAGVWDFEAGVVKLFLFRPVPPQARENIFAQAQRTGSFMARGEVEIKPCDRMTPLTLRPAGGVMAPLKGS